MKKGHVDVVLGEVEFANERLSSVSRNWESQISNERDFGRILIGLLHSLQEEGSSFCLISSHYSSTPEMDDKMVKLGMWQEGTDARACRI